MRILLPWSCLAVFHDDGSTILGPVDEDSSAGHMAHIPRKDKLMRAVNSRALFPGAPNSDGVALMSMADKTSEATTLSPGTTCMLVATFGVCGLVVGVYVWRFVVRSDWVPKRIEHAADAEEVLQRLLGEHEQDSSRSVVPLRTGKGNSTSILRGSNALREPWTNATDESAPGVGSAPEELHAEQTESWEDVFEAHVQDEQDETELRRNEAESHVEGENESHAMQDEGESSAPKSDAKLTESALESGAELTESAPKSDAQLTESAPKSDAQLTESAPKSDAKLTESAPKSDAELTESAQKSDAELTESAPKSDAQLTESAQKSDASLEESQENAPSKGAPRESNISRSFLFSSDSS